MQIIKDIKKQNFIKSSVVTLGNFDGVHKGHQKVLKAVKDRADKLKSPSVVYTFDPHPLKIIAPHKCPLLLTTPEEKIKLIKASGIDYLILAKFTKEFAFRHPGEFVEDVLVNKLRAKEVLVGHDYAFGKGRQGTIKYLKVLGNKFAFNVRVMPACKKNGVIISSSIIREYIGHGKVKDAASFLGRPYSVSGYIIKGRNIGRHIGFPTANIDIHNELIPKDGVYAVRVFLGNKIHNGVANIGFSPTFHTNKRSVEVHILNFQQNIYGKNIRIEFIQRLRNEITFKNADGLAAQIEKDVNKAKKIFK